MALAKYQKPVQDSAGNIVTAITVTVRKETAGAPLATLYEDAAGATPLSNPATFADGVIEFYTAGNLGGLRLDIAATGYSATWRNEPCGTGAQVDADTVLGGAFNYEFEAATTAPPSSGNVRANHATWLSATAIYVSESNSAGSDLAAILALADAGDRIIITNQDGTQGAAVVTGNTDSGAYRTITIGTVTGDAPVVGAIGFRILTDGVDGADGDMTGPVSSTDNALARFDGTGGGTVQDSGVTVDDSNNMSVPGAIELGHASDTTLSRVAAGRVAVEGAELQKQPSSDGLVARTSAGAAAARSIAGTASQITVTNGDGVSGNPTISADVASQAEAEAGSNATKLMTPQRTAQAISALGGSGGLTLVSDQQPTSDVTDITATGLSGYSFVKIMVIVQLTDSAANLILEARSSGGTWRSIGSTPNTAGTEDMVMISADIAGFNAAQEKVVSGIYATDTTSLDSSDSDNTVDSSVTSKGYFPSWNEVWAEVRVRPSAGSIEGSTADQRGRFYVYGG